MELKKKGQMLNRISPKRETEIGWKATTGNCTQNCRRHDRKGYKQFDYKKKLNLN